MFAPVLLSLMLVAEPPEERVRREEQKLAGTWRVIGAESGGVMVPPKEYRDLQLTFRDGKFVAQKGEEKPQEGTYSIEPLKDPKQMDIVRRSGDRKVRQQGIYTLNGDILRICASTEERPDGFHTRDKPDRTLLTLRRVP